MHDDLELKKQFALALLKTPDDPFEAGIAVFGNNTGEALRVSRRWLDDPDVLRFKEEALKLVGEASFLPTKTQLAREAYKLAIDIKLHADDRIKAMRLYADINGYIEKNGPVINNNILTTNKVMLVRDTGTTEEWENKMALQQSRLIEDANAERVN